MRSSKKADGSVTVSASNTTTSSAGAASPSGGGDGEPSPYELGEKVLASHNGVFYEAKVEKVEYHLEKWRYYIHYRGWNRSWDEWVRRDLLMKYTDQNLKRKDVVDNIDKNVKVGRTSQVKPESSADPSGKKRKNDSTVSDQKRKRKHSVIKGKDSTAVEKAFDISIPPKLRQRLIDDSEFINQMGKVVQLPRTPNVDDILKKYHDYRKKKDGVISESVGEILNGLRVYFDKALPVILLYNKERQQYQEAIKDDISPSTVYGAEHLLRLFVKLPKLLRDLNIEEETLREMQEKLHDFLKFLQKNLSTFFLSSYHMPEASRKSTRKGGG